MSELSYDEKIKLKENLTKIEHHVLVYIFDMIQKKNIKFTRNNSGIHIREDHIDPETLRFIYNFVEEKLKENRLYRSL